ncbi:MAG: hypothetical protein J5796_05480 [Erysipelotrichaceae bacterium]|nr:hypothetical protein [Erysipelotrichaceae bacterium]
MHSFIDIVVLVTVIALVCMCMRSLMQSRKKGCSCCGKKCTSCPMCCRAVNDRT